MVKLALKHFIYDQCINMFYDEVYNNFIKPRIDVDLLRSINDSFTNLIANKVIESVSTRIGLDGSIIVDVKLSTAVDYINLSGFIENLNNQRN